MIKVEDSVVIERPIEDVFAYVADQTNAPHWQAGLVEVRRTTDGPIGVGARHTALRSFMGRRMELTNEYVTFEPNREITFLGASGPLTVQASYLFEATTEGVRLTSRVLMQAGGLFRVAERLIAADLRRDNVETLGVLKDSAGKARGVGRSRAGGRRGAAERSEAMTEASAQETPYAAELKVLFGTALAVFVVTVGIGLVNGQQVVALGRPVLLTHLHIGTLVDGAWATTLSPSPNSVTLLTWEHGSPQLGARLLTTRAARHRRRTALRCSPEAGVRPAIARSTGGRTGHDGDGSVTTCAVGAKVIDRMSMAFEASCSGIRLSNGEPRLSLPRLTLIAISQRLATLNTTSFVSSSMRPRARALRCSSPLMNQRKA